MVWAPRAAVCAVATARCIGCWVAVLGRWTLAGTLVRMTGAEKRTRALASSGRCVARPESKRAAEARLGCTRPSRWVALLVGLLRTPERRPGRSGVGKTLQHRLAEVDREPQEHLKVNRERQVASGMTPRGFHPRGRNRRVGGITDGTTSPLPETPSPPAWGTRRCVGRVSTAVETDRHAVVLPPSARDNSLQHSSNIKAQLC